MSRSVFVFAGLALACTGPSKPETAAQADPWSAVQLARAIDTNPDPKVVEIALTARAATHQYPNSEPSEVWTYNGTVPGPLIEANVGDELVVHFENQLPEPTTIHWHGIRLPAQMDGTLAMQAPIPPGGSFEYRFVLKDAGLFWFHPHIRSDVQIEKGLYGTLLVRGAEEPKVDREAVFVLDDVRVLPDGTFPDYLDDLSKMMGRQGNVLLVNGTSLPTLPVRRGAVHRLRLVNVANGRFFNLALPGHSFRVIGTDGGLLPKPYDTDRLLLSPGERYDLLLVPDGAPGELTLTNEPYERGHDSAKEPPLPMAVFQLSDDEPLSPQPLPTAFGSIERLPASAIDHTLTLSEAFDADGQLVFTINGVTHPDVPKISVTNGAIRVFDVLNESDMDHPFHLHGFFFQTLEEDGIAVLPEALANKDTRIIRAHGSARIVARFDEPGAWMYHCHILEHAEGGMMGEINVLP